jgi:hypothetical protein
MDAWVVYESMFGNTRAVAEAIASGMGDRAVVMSVAEAPSVVPASVSLVVAGGPTHAFGMSRTTTRQDAVSRGAVERVAPGGGLREWLDGLTIEASTRVATFDTRIDKMRHLPGSAARAAARAMRRTGHRTLVKPESFYVRDIDGPLLEGETDRAREWGSALFASVTATWS